MGLLDWRSGEHFDHRADCPCVHCGKPTPLRSHTGEATHKVCAENWTDRNPGSDRYRSDPPRKNGRQKDNHA